MLQLRYFVNPRSGVHYDNVRARATKRRVWRLDPSQTSRTLTSLADLSLSFGRMLIAYYYVSKMTSCVEEIRSVDDV